MPPACDSPAQDIIVVATLRKSVGGTSHARIINPLRALAEEPGVSVQLVADDNVRVYAMHPGWADTPGVASSLQGFRAVTGPLLRTPEQGADTAIWLAATEPAPPTDGFWHDRRPRPEHYLPTTRHGEGERDRLWRYCAYSVGIDNA